jgi:hypothetical protein
MRANAATVIAVMPASQPPAITTSEVSSRMSRSASPMALEPAAQAVVMLTLGPVKRNRMLMWPAAALAIIIGT